MSGAPKTATEGEVIEYGGLLPAGCLPESSWALGALREVPEFTGERQQVEGAP